MSAPNSQDWERLKHVLCALYIGKGHTLEGPEGVMKLMETQHGLKATKTQYEKQFKDWGFQKNRTKQDWKDIGQKIWARKRMAKESNIYLDGKLVPAKKVRKEISRQAYMTIYEQFHQGQESPPGMPPGFEIRTPTALPLLRLVFENLPMFRFQEIMPQLQEFIRPVDTSSSALTPFLGDLQRTRNPNAVLPILNSMLPNSALLEEGCANGLAIERVESLESVEFFNLIVFMISNNFPGESNSRNIYKWLKKNCPPFILKTLSSMATPTAEALLENLFGSAVEAGDVTMVKHLLKAGASPNRPMCRHSSLPDHVTPLQFALSRGNTELAQELIKAGSSINEGGAGWKSSALVLAIIGNNIRGNKRFWGSHGSFSGDGDEDNDYMDTRSLFEPSSQDFAVSGTENDPFFDLIQSLLNTGAAINPDGVGRSCSSIREWEDDWSPFLDDHSPLTAASKYRHKQLVDVFLQRGADVRFLTNRDASALHECLYSWEEMNDARQLPQSLSERGELRSFPGSGNLSSLVDVAQSLISAGAAVNDESGFSFKPSPSESDFIYCTTLDLGVLTGSAELFDMLVGAGACTATKVSLEHAIYNGYTEIVTRLLNIGAPLAIEAIDGLIESDESCFYAISLLRPNIRIKRALFQEAIRLGATSIINYILNSETSNPQKLFYDMTEAFQQCCAEGHINALRLLLSKSSTFKVSISPWFGRAIEVAIENGHDDILDILLSADPDVDVIVHRESVLLAALRKKNTRIIEKLIRAGVRLSKRNEKCSECERIHESNDVFIAAINLGDYHVINSLVDAVASLHTLGTTDCMLGSKLCMLPLTAAIVGKDLTLVNHLISAGAAMNNPPEAASTTPTPLSAAIANRDLELANTLIQRGSNPYDSIALSEATNEFRLLQTLLMALHNFNEPSNSYSDTLGWEALYRAVEKQDLVMTQELLNSPLREMKSSQGLCAGLIQTVRFDSSPNFEIIRKFLSLRAC
ncbi:hypothetical protein BGZ57DRAFT_965322 [Hyaloscypha finlandica]|nr:hypothetical protein BGZ57DRAFT_965322 [Hyaloscypha finlandica]